jgi:hypothetical protein
MLIKNAFIVLSQTDRRTKFTSKRKNKEKRKDFKNQCESENNISPLLATDTQFQICKSRFFFGQVRLSNLGSETGYPNTFAVYRIS